MTDETTTSNLRIDGARLWGGLMASAEIGPGKAGGLCRLAASDADKAMRDLFGAWCEEAGLTVTIDRLGNMFARRPGRDNDLAPVTMGSHLDTQYAGGRFDGILGVLSGLEVIRTLNNHSVETVRPLEVINWTNEEGCRFAPPMASAGAFAGVYSEEFVATRADDDGLLQGAELERIGYRGPAPVGGRTLDAYFELHIEQGPILDAEAIPVGIVTGGYKSFGAHVDVHGETAHAGPTPMEKRRDALVGAARVVAAVNDIGWKYQNTLGKTTVTRLVAWPNKPGIISEWAQFSLDCRHPDPATAETMWAEIEAAIPAAAERARVAMEITTRWEFGNERFDADLIGLLRGAAWDLGVKSRDLLSQAGHDAYHVSKCAPTAMIFSPCINGITHNEAEDIDLRMTEPAVNVLLHAVLARANRQVAA
jgi:N-carbamoyl-L-amino-acid hydrolase